MGGEWASALRVIFYGGFPSSAKQGKLLNGSVLARQEG